MIAALLALVFAAAPLTREEIVARFKTPPVIQCEGLVRVWAFCPRAMRQEFQLPVAGFAAGICRQLYSVRREKPVKCAAPGIDIHLGDATTNNPALFVSTRLNEEGRTNTVIRVVAPGFVDLERFRLEIARGFVAYWDGRCPDDEEVRRLLRETDPVLRLEDKIASVESWWRGVYEPGHTDEDYLKLARSVLSPGRANALDLAVFRARLVLEPRTADALFCGKHASCSFREAIGYGRMDPFVRLAALDKARQLQLQAGGRGEKMVAVARAYALFLLKMAEGNTADAALEALLAEADKLFEGMKEE